MQPSPFQGPCLEVYRLVRSRGKPQPNQKLDGECQGQYRTGESDAQQAAQGQLQARGGHSDPAAREGVRRGVRVRGGRGGRRSASFPQAHRRQFGRDEQQAQEHRGVQPLRP
jgi:hypothetical protein